MTPYSTTPAGPAPDVVGTPLPPVIETDSPVMPYGNGSFSTGMVSSTTIDQSASGPQPVPGPPVPLDIFDPNTWFVSDPSFLMPWDLAPTACRDCRTNGLVVFHNYSSWRGISEGSGSNNNGFAYGANYGTKLGVVSDYTGIGRRSAAATACTI